MSAHDRSKCGPASGASVADSARPLAVLEEGCASVVRVGITMKVWILALQRSWETKGPSKWMP